MARKQPPKTSERLDFIIALGTFVDEYATTEKHLHFSFERFARLNRLVAMAIKGAMSTSDLISLTKRVMIARRWEKQDCDDVSKALDQLAALQEFRNRVLHRGASFESDTTLLSTNMATMKSYDAAEFISFTVEDISNATADVVQVRNRISLVTHKRYFHRRFSDVDLEEMRRRPWRYKPLKPETLLQRIQKEALVRAIRQRSSRKK